jgi:multicomponent Na+:H+ antiporter subunit A
MTAAVSALAAVSMAGLALSLGFIAKEQLYDTVTLGLPEVMQAATLVAAVLASAALGAVAFNAGFAPFIGSSVPSPSSHDAPPSLWAGPLLMGIAGLMLGTMPALLDVPVGLAAKAVNPSADPVHLAMWHGVTPTLLLSMGTLAGSLVLFAYRERIRRLPWPGALHTESLYSFAETALDATSRRVSPWLQGASLRSYVLTVLVAAVTFAGTALVTSRILPEPRRWTPVQVHEVIIAALIVAGAVSAVLARTNMAAVLSLGTVGYGVAVMYGFLGAPDLAMTQFAVETLTVVVFVLVFYRLRGFGDLSSRAVKLRDAVVALAAGALVTTMVLYTGASGTTSRLAPYFAETAPGQGHGRNIVNVILVDFRGLDTLGEVTVLVTVAIGVRALLLIGKERK